MMATVVSSGPPAGDLPGAVAANSHGVALLLIQVTWRESSDQDRSSAPGVTLYVPPGQSLALHGKAPGDAAELLDVIAGLRRPISGQVGVDGVEVGPLSGQARDRYRLGFGLLSPRFPLVPSLSAVDNVLAEP